MSYDAGAIHRADLVEQRELPVRRSAATGTSGLRLGAGDSKTHCFGRYLVTSDSACEDGVTPIGAAQPSTIVIAGIVQQDRQLDLTP